MELVLFKWWVWTGGYELRDVGGELHICEHGSGEHRNYTPTDTRVVFKRFAELGALDDEEANFADAALAFAREYGLLGLADTLPPDAPTDRRFEPLRLWTSESRRIRQTLEFRSGLRAKRSTVDDNWSAALRLIRSSGPMAETTRPNLPTEGQAQLPFARMVAAFSDGNPEAFTKQTLAVHVGTKLRQLKVGTTVVFDEESDEMRFAIEPPSLLGAIWLHLAVGLRAGVEFRPCRVCDRFIEIGLHQTGKRADTTTCSPACRAKLFREVKKKKAREAAIREERSQ